MPHNARVAQGRSGARSNPTATQDVLPWSGELVAVQGRSAPVLQAVLVRPDTTPAGVRTQPVVDKHVRNTRFVSYRFHRPYRMEIPTTPPAVQSSRFQPVVLWRSGWTDTKPGGSWLPPPRFSGLFHRAAVLVLPNPGGAQQLPRWRWTRTIRVPRYSTLPPEYTPTPAGAR